MSASAIIENVRKNIKRIEKIEINNDTPNRKHLTWKLTQNKIYMYDCGDNYASAASLASYEELLEEIKRGLSDNTKEIIINYNDGNQDVITYN